MWVVFLTQVLMIDSPDWYVSKITPYYSALYLLSAILFECPICVYM